jgi:hypothetical protein
MSRRIPKTLRGKINVVLTALDIINDITRGDPMETDEESLVNSRELANCIRHHHVTACDDGPFDPQWNGEQLLQWFLRTHPAS